MRLRNRVSLSLYKPRASRRPGCWLGVCSVMLAGAPVIAAGMPALTMAGAPRAYSADSLARTLNRAGELGGVSVMGYQIEELPDVFAEPSARQRHGKICTLRYADLDVALTFSAGRPYRGCDPASLFASARLTGTWQTSRGLQVGDRVGRIKQLYPNARENTARCGSGKLTRLAFIGPAAGQRPKLRRAMVAQVSKGRIKALGICVPDAYNYVGA
jgi:hypothetical protein